MFRVKISGYPTDRMSILLGDFIANLRFSLDHLIWFLSTENHPRLQHWDETEFPIFIERNGEAVRKRIKWLKPPQRKIVRDLQPYTGGEARHEHPLWLIHELANLDKHKKIAIILPDLTFRAGTADEPDLSGITFYGELHDGDVFRWPVFPSRTEPDVRYQAVMTFSIPFDNPAMHPFPIGLIDGLYYFVRDNVFAPLHDISTVKG